MLRAVALGWMLVSALCQRDAAAQGAAAPTTPAATHGEEVRIAFERPVVYSGETHLSWMSHNVPFAEKRGVTVGALLRVVNASNAPVYLYGRSREALAVGIEVPQNGGWGDLPLPLSATGLQPLPLAAGESLELQVPLPAGEPTIRISLKYWTTYDANWEKGGSLTASSAAIDVHRWSGGAALGAAGRRPGKQDAKQEPAAVGRTAPALRGGASGSTAPSVSAPPRALAPGVHLTFDRTLVYSGKTHDAWTMAYAFVDKRGETIGALLRVTNATSAPIWVLGSNRDALSVGVEVRGRNDWRGLLISESSADLKPIALAAGESIEVQVPLPDDARNMRVSIRYREVDNPDWQQGGWQTLYSDSIDLRRSNSKKK
jgi:hypothetical protein